MTSILVVEDNRRDELLMLRALNKAHLNARVAVARDGQQALDYLFCQGEFAGRPTPPPDLVLLDISLPRRSGLDVLRILRGDARTSGIPIVMVSSSDEERDRQAARADGANDYVTKPMEFADLVAAVGRLGARWLVRAQPPGSG